MARRIKKAEVRFISLCPKGANKLPTMYKEDAPSKDGSVSFSAPLLMAKDTDLGEILAVVYAPDMVDSQGEYASREVIREAMHSAAKTGFDVDIRHDGKALSKDDAYVAESFEIQKYDPRFKGMVDDDGNAVDVSGGWGVLIKVDKPELRELYRQGKWSGVSMGGSYVPETLEKAEESASRNILKRLAEALGLKYMYAHQNISLSGEIDMTGDELKKTLTENNAALAKSIVDGITAALKPGASTATPATTTDAAAPQVEDKPALFKGDPTDAKAVEAHLKSLEKQTLLKSVDWADPKSVAAYHVTLKKVDVEQEDDASQSEDTSELVKSLEEQVAALKKRSNQSAGEGSGMSHMTKEQRDCYEASERMIKHLADRNKPIFG